MASDVRAPRREVRGPGAPQPVRSWASTRGRWRRFLVRPKPQRSPDRLRGGRRRSQVAWRIRAARSCCSIIWATWCVPCREEMPALDKLQTALGGKDFEVVAINIDRGGPDKARDFLKEIGVNNLALYTDPSGKLFWTIKTVGMPTTLSIDRERQGDRPAGRPGGLGLAGGQGADRGRDRRARVRLLRVHRDDRVLLQAIGHICRSRTAACCRACRAS